MWIQFQKQEIELRLKLVNTTFKVVTQIVSEHLTCDQSESTYAGEGGDVQIHPLQISGELDDAVNPLPEAPQALEPVPHWPVAEDQLPFFWVGSEMTACAISR